MRSYSLVLIVTVLAFSSQAKADIIIDGTLTNEQNAFVSSEGGFRADASISVDPLGFFDVDFGVLGEENFSVTWQAPPGQLVEIAPPVGFDSYRLFFRYRTQGSFLTPGVDANPFVPVFSGVSGDPLDLQFSSLNFTSPGGNNMGGFMSFDIAGGETYRFRSLTATGTVPASYAVNFSNLPVRDFNILGEANTLDGGITPPGQWVRLVPVPEPNPFVMVSLIGLLVACRWRLK